MALTVASLQGASISNKRMVTAKITFDSSYLTGGESLTPAMLGMSVIDFVLAHPVGGYVFEYDYTNQTLMVYSGGGAAAHTHDFKIIGGQASAGTDAISAKTLTLGKEAATDITIAGANSATLGGVVATTASTAAMTETDSATNLSAVTTRILVIGR